MKQKNKKFLILTALATLAMSYVFCPQVQANSASNDIALLTQKGFFKEAPKSPAFSTPCKEVKRALYKHLEYANKYNLEGLKSLYSPNYITSDGLSEDIYFELIKKTWDSYPNIKYKINIKSIEIEQDTAFAQVQEEAIALTNTKSGVIDERGLLQSTSSNIYYFEKINNEWLITSDYALSEKTSLRYGSAKMIPIDIVVPSHIPAGTEYTAALKMNAPKDTLIVASIGQEETTYPQVVAKEVFRKLPADGILERVFTSNKKNINEYSVASFGITKAEVNKDSEIKIYVTGLGFVMSRVNVIPKNNFVKALKEENKNDDSKDE